MAKNNKKKYKRIFLNYWNDYVVRHPNIPPYILSTISKVIKCGTEALGCTVFKCRVCELYTLIKHSCKSRFCSICGTAYIDKWSAKIKYWLSFINASYYFITFTIPKPLENIAQLNKRPLYSALFKSSSYTILSFQKEKRVTGGIISIIHTFGRTLNFHPHIHMLCTYGGLLFNKTAWKEVFIPAKVLQYRFKKHFLDTLRTLYKQGLLEFPEDMKLKFKSFNDFDSFLDKLGRSYWQIERKGPIDAIGAALSYIARYLGKPPMSENRIWWYSKNKVCFTYKDYLNKAVIRNFICSTDEFFSRLIEHVPLPNFPSVRFYGLFSTRNKKKLMDIASELIPAPDGVALLRTEPPKTCRQHRIAEGMSDPMKCPKCGRELEFYERCLPGSLEISFEEKLKRLNGNAAIEDSS